jgi:hypothetical protein
MKRQIYTATLLTEDGSVVATATKYAMNSAIRETESLVRAIARGENTFYTGGRPGRVGDVYLRRWVSDNGRVVVARAWKEIGQ